MTTIKKKLKYSSPRLEGIYEQHKRAKRFVQLAHCCKKPATKFRNLIAAVYPARAIVELMLEAVEKQELRAFKNKDTKACRNKFEEEIIPKLPYYHLLENIRIHDFHRFGCLPPSQKYQSIFVGGPIKLTANKGSASLVLLPAGHKFTVTGNSSVKTQRPLYTNNGFFFDEETNEDVPLDRVLSDFLSVVPRVLSDFENHCQTR